MTLTLTRFGKSTPADTNNATLYTVPASTTARVEEIIVCNSSTSSVTCRVFLVASGESADTTTAIRYDYNIPANSAHHIVLRQTLDTGGTIVVRSGTASDLTFIASGQVET